MDRSSIIIALIFLFFFIILGIFFQYVPTLSLLSDLTEDAKILSARAKVESDKIDEIMNNTEKLRNVLSNFEDVVFPIGCRLVYLGTNTTPGECRA